MIYNYTSALQSLTSGTQIYGETDLDKEYALKNSFFFTAYQKGGVYKFYGLSHLKIRVFFQPINGGGGAKKIACLRA